MNTSRRNIDQKVENKGVDRSEPIYPIGVVSRLLGISVYTLRMYEREGLILTQRGTNQKNRLYSISDIERMECIRDAITNRKYSIPAIKAILSLIPCWKVINCNESDRLNCLAYATTGSPCWTFRHQGNICESKDCRKCPVYLNFTSCEEIKNFFK